MPVCCNILSSGELSQPTRLALNLVPDAAGARESARLLFREELRDRYQIIHHTYPTTEPVLASAALFRASLAEFLRDVEYDPAVTPKLVLVGHSMGGLLAKSLIVDSGRAIWERVFTRGSGAAEGTTGGTARVRGVDDPETVAVRRTRDLPRHATPRQLMSITQTDDTQLLAKVREVFRRGRVTSVESLSPTYIPGMAFAALPVAAGVPIHSIIGNSLRRGPDGYDGYVTVRSAHIDGADSELILPVRHMEFDRIEPLNEVYRILRLHASGVAVQPGPTPESCASPPATPGAG